METGQNTEAVATLINDHLRNGRDPFKIIDQFRAIPKPIFVDFNNVLADNNPDQPLVLNPAANRFMEELYKLGNPVVLTSAQGWNEVYSFLDSNRLWQPGMVLINGIALAKITDFDRKDNVDLLPEYLKLLNKPGEKSYDIYDFYASPPEKRVAHIFNKPFDVPLIDDFFSAIYKNPGIYGIYVEKWDPVKPELKKPTDRVQRLTLDEAAERVKKHYEKIKF